MNKTALFLIAALLITACAPQAQEPIACTMDAKICPDGSAVGRVGPDCEFAACPGETGGEQNLGTFKHYISQDVQECSLIRYMCAEGEGFSDETGCGCIISKKDAAVTSCLADYDPVCAWSDPEKIQCFAHPCATTQSNLCTASTDPNVAYTTPGECPPVGSDPEREYVNTNQTQCAATTWLCDAGEQQFFDETGCGCEPVEEVACPAEREEFCTKEYMPVCGRSVLNTGKEVYETYGNKCEACAAMKVVGYTQGACDLGVPQEAQEKHTELADQYGESLGATLERCANTDQVVYIAAGSGGFSGVSYYYEANGNLMGTYEWDDMVIVGEEEPQPPIDVADYSCTVLEKTETSKLQATDCTEPRPEVCTMQYDPVCGQRDDGTSDTYGNSCSACGDSDVISWVPGEC